MLSRDDAKYWQVIGVFEIYGRKLSFESISILYTYNYVYNYNIFVYNHNCILILYALYLPTTKTVLYCRR